MTLILTELTPAGICLAADSAITKVQGGNIREIDEQGWTKVLRVPKITSAVSYWGVIGAITTQRFDHYLQAVIQQEAEYDSLASFAEHVVRNLNKSSGGKPLPNDWSAGVHIAGFAPWDDGENRPVFYHVHNGHGEYKLEERTVRVNGQDIFEIIPKWIAEPRRLFAVHQDFPRVDIPLAINLQTLKAGYITRNGAYLEYAVMWKFFENALLYLNAIQGTSIPRDPNDIASRKGFIHAMLETVIRLYKVSNKARVVGGTVTSLGVRANGYVL